MQIQPIKFLRDELRSNAGSTLFSAVSAVLTGLALSVWAAVEGWDGPSIALAGLGATAAVVVIAVSIAIAARLGLLSHAWVKAAIRVAALLALIIVGNWFVGILGELRTLRKELAAARNITPEDVTHASLIRELQTEISNLGNELSNTKLEVSGLRGQLSTVAAELSTTQSQLTTSQSLVTAGQSQVSDLQQQMQRIQQPPAVVVGAGGGVPVNQKKMNLIAEWQEAGRKIQNAAPRNDAADSAVKPWIDNANKWFNELLAGLKKECTPQAVSVVQNQSGQLPVTHGSIHQGKEAQGAYRGLDRILGNLTNLLQRPEMCP